MGQKLNGLKNDLDFSTYERTQNPTIFSFILTRFNFNMHFNKKKYSKLGSIRFIGVHEDEIRAPTCSSLLVYLNPFQLQHALNKENKYLKLCSSHIKWV